MNESQMAAANTLLSFSQPADKKPKLEEEAADENDFGMKFYDSSTIQKMIRELEDGYKNNYVKPEYVPYNKNMARQFSTGDSESQETRQRRSHQAVTSRVCRDKTKFMRAQIEESNENQHARLRRVITNLVNVECWVNDIMRQNGKEAIDWKKMWQEEEDTSCGSYKTIEQTIEDLNKKLKPAQDSNGYDSDDDRLVIDQSSTMQSDTENMSIYENEVIGAYSGEENWVDEIAWDAGLWPRKIKIFSF